MDQLHAIYGWVLAHPLRTLVGWWTFSNAVLYMPPVEPNSSGLYKWAFGFLHAAAGAIPRLASNVLPAGSWITKLLAGGNGLVNSDPAPPAAPATPKP
jgi:hypothetical protein